MLRIARKSVVWYNGIARHQTPGQQWSEASSNRTRVARRRCRHVEIPELGKSDGQCSHRSDNSTLNAVCLWTEQDFGYSETANLSRNWRNIPPLRSEPLNERNGLIVGQTAEIPT